MTNEKSLCWLRFLNARAEVIDWMLAEFQYSDEETARHLSMDPVQVRLIRERDRRLDVWQDEPPVWPRPKVMLAKTATGDPCNCRPGECAVGTYHEELAGKYCRKSL